MPCCKAKEFKWCQDLDVVYTDLESKEYCVFHAPAEHKGISVEEFNKLVFRRIDQTVDKGTCDLSGTVFSGDISFSNFGKEHPFPSVNFSLTAFSGYADFGKAAFSGDADFREAAFSGDADFRKAAFSNKKIANFCEATFSRDANFREAAFNAYATFSQATFIGAATFSQATFTGAADFDEAVFNNFTSFYTVEFHLIAHFHRASFKDFGDFKNAKFMGGAIFFGARCKDLDFTGASFSKYARFDDITVEKRLLFEGIANPGNLYLPCDGLEKLHFHDVVWPIMRGRRVILNETLLPYHLPGSKEEAEAGSDSELFNRLNKARGVYRKLKRKSLSEHDYPEASEWRYSEKEMVRQVEALRFWWWPITTTNIYYLCSGYGERPLKAGTALGMLVVLFILILSMVGLTPAQNAPDFVKILPLTFIEIYGRPDFTVFKYLVVEAFKNIFYMSDTFFLPLSFGGYVVIFLAKVIIPFQAARLALIIKNRFRE